MKRLDFSKPVTRRLTPGSNDYTNPTRPSRHVTWTGGRLPRGKLPGEAPEEIPGGKLPGEITGGKSPRAVHLLRVIFYLEGLQQPAIYSVCDRSRLSLLCHIDVTWSRDSEHPCHLLTIDGNPFAGSTPVLGPPIASICSLPRILSQTCVSQLEVVLFGRAGVGSASE